MKLGVSCAVLLVMLAASGCLAEPFLICDPYPAKDPQPTKFVVTRSMANPRPLLRTAMPMAAWF